MKHLVKSAAIGVLSRPPMLTALRAYAQRGNPTTILCYHTLRPNAETFDAWTALGVDDFRTQIAALRRHYDIVSLDDAMALRGQAGRPRAVLTFDDGEWGLFAHLLPIVEELSLPVTAYIATRQIEMGQAYWFDRVMNALQVVRPCRIQLEGVEWQIDSSAGKARWEQIGAILETIKQAPEDARDTLADQVIAQAGAVAQDFTPLRPMTRGELTAVADHPLMTIGAHSHGHELLDLLPIDVASKSIAQSKSWLEDVTRRPVRHFAYPNGNYSPALMDEIARLGFETATILTERPAPSTANNFALPRIGVGRYDSLGQFQLGLMGLR